MQRHPNYPGAPGDASDAPEGASNSGSQPCNPPQYNPYDPSASVPGQPDVQQQPHAAQQFQPDNTFQNYTQQNSAPQHQQPSQQPGYAAEGTYWPGYQVDYQHQYPTQYDDPNAGLWTGTAEPYMADAMAMGSPPDLFSAEPSMENSAGSAELRSAAQSDQPDMLPHPHSAASADAAASQPPDMLPSAAPADMPATGAEVELGVEMDGAASGPDILSNGMRGDDRTRPDILSPATEECSPEVSGSRSSSAVLHSPTGAFEPVYSSTSRTNSVSGSEHSISFPQHTGTTVAPLWDQTPALPPVQLQPATYMPTVPVQVLPTQVLQAMGAEAMATGSVEVGNTVASITRQMNSLTFTDGTSAHNVPTEANVQVSTGYHSMSSNSMDLQQHTMTSWDTQVVDSLQAPPSTLAHTAPHAAQSDSSFTPINSVPEVVSSTHSNEPTNEQQESLPAVANEQANLADASADLGMASSAEQTFPHHVPQVSNQLSHHSTQHIASQQTLPATTLSQPALQSQPVAAVSNSTVVPNQPPAPSYSQPISNPVSQYQPIVADVTVSQPTSISFSSNMPLNSGNGSAVTAALTFNSAPNQPMVSGVPLRQPIPGYAGTQPINMSSQPVITGMQSIYPGTLLMNPPVQPTGTGAQHINPGVQPMNTSSQPMISGAQLMSSGMQPVFSGAQPMFSGAQPMFSGAQPINTGAQPINTGAQPINTGAQPINTGAQPINTGAQPMNTGAQPINTGAQPISTGSQPISTSTQSMNIGAQPMNAGVRPMNPGMMPNYYMNPNQPMMNAMNPGNQQMNYGMAGNQPMGYGMNYGMMSNGMMNTGMIGYQQPGMHPGMMMNNQYQQGMNAFGNQQQPNAYTQMDPQMQQRMAMMKGFKPLTQQQLSGHQSGYHQPRPGLSNAPAPMRVTGPMMGQHPQQGYGGPQTPPVYNQYGNEPRMPRNQSFGGYRQDDSYSSPAAGKKKTRSYRDDDNSGYGRPRSRDVYEERRGYGYGSRPSSRSGSRPSSRTGSAAPDYDSEIDRHMDTRYRRMFQSEVNPYLMNQSGFSPRPPSRTSSRLDSVYQQSHAEDDSLSSSDSEPVEPPRGTPAKFPMPHVIPRLLSNGDTLEVQPNSPDDGQPATICVLRRHLYRPSLIKFPGPLVKGQTHKRDVLDYCNKMAQSAREDATLLDRDSTELLWKFLHLLVKQNGTYVGSDIAELLLEGYEVDSTLYAVQSQPKANANMTQQQTTDRFRQLVMFGNTKEALEWAMSTDQWGHALFLSSKMGSRIHAQVLTRFANSSMTHNDPLQTLYQLMSNRQPNSATHPDDGWGTWRPHLAMMLCNPSSDAQLNVKSITSLGDSLAAKGLLHASQFCYLMADLPLEPFTKKLAKLSMIGIQSGVSLEEYTHETAVELTEIYEYARSLAGDIPIIPHLQICKFYHARKQIDRGQPNEALAYLEAIASKVSAHVELFSWAFVSQLYNLSESLKYYDAEATYVRDGRSLELEWINNLGTSLQAKLAISASGEVVGTPLGPNTDTIDYLGSKDSVGAAHAATAVSGLTDATDNYQQVPHATGSYEATGDTGGHQQGTGDIVSYQQATDANVTSGYQQVPTGATEATNATSNYQQDLSAQNPYTSEPDQYQQQDPTVPTYEPPQAGYGYQTNPPEPWRASNPPTTQTTDYSNLGAYNHSEGATHYENASYKGFSSTTSAADNQVEDNSQHTKPTDYYDYKPPSLHANSTSNQYASSSGGGSVTSYGAIPGYRTDGRKLSASFPSQPKTLSKPATPSSRSLSNSSTGKSLAELIKEKREFEKYEAALADSVQSRFMSQPSAAPAAPASKTGTSKPSDSAAASKARSSPAKGFGFGIGSLISKILPKGKNEIILPDESKQTIVWDEKLKKWIDTESDGTEESKAGPPPTDSTLGRASPAVQAAPAGASAPAANSQPAGSNLYSLKRGRGSKYVDVMGKTAVTSLSPIPQHLFDVTPRSTPTSSIFTPTPTSTDENGDVEPEQEVPDQQTGQSQHYQTQQHQTQHHQAQQHQPQHEHPPQQHIQQHPPQQHTQQHPPQQHTQQHPPQQQWNHEQSDGQMPRNTSMASLEVQNIMSGPPSSLKGPPAGGHPPPTHTAPANHQAPPNSALAPPHSSQAPPTSMQAPPHRTQAPPASAQAPPTSQHNDLDEGQSSASSMPPMMFNPSQFKMPSSAPGGRTGTLSSRNRYPK